MIAGGLAGILTWVIMEPQKPPLGDADWSRWEMWVGLVLGGLIGLALGGVSGFFQGSRSHLIRGIGFGALMGAIGGTISISMGSGLYQALKPILGEVARILGFVLFGGFIGLSEGIVGLSIKRAYYGLIGGLLGGAAGGFAFVSATAMTANLQSTVSGGNEVGGLGRALSFTIIGLGIGLMIGVVEAIGRKAWVRLVLGRNEGREWAVDAPNFILGRSETAHVPLMGDPNVLPQHAVIHRHGGQWLVSALDPVPAIVHNGVPVKQAALASGDQFMIGPHLLEFYLRGQVTKRVPSQAAVAAPANNYARQPVSTGGLMMQTQGPATGMGMPTTQMPAQPMPGMPQMPTTAMPAAGGELVAISGPLAGQRFPVRAVLEVGRESGPIPLQFDTMVSRRHATLTPTPDGVMVSDLGSTNGTSVNGARIQQALVRRGETLTLGITTFRLE